VKKGQVFLADFAYVPRGGKAAGVPALQTVRSDRVHGVVVLGEPSVVIGQLIGDDAGATGEFAVGEFQCTGQLFAGELAGGKARKACLLGRTLSLKGEPVVQLSRAAAVTVLPGQGQGIADAGIGPLTIVLDGKTFSLFSTDHEYPRMACISQKIGAGAAAAPPAGEKIADVPAACRRFASLPQRIDLAARLVEAELLRQGASARLGQADKEPDVLNRARQALQAGSIEQAEPLIAEAGKQALALHAQADQAGKPVVAFVTRAAAAELLPPVVAAQDRYAANYLVSFAEEQTRDAVQQRAQLLCRAAMGRPEAEKLCADVRGAEARLLEHYFGLPICWTRQHIPGQPVFFWRPIMLEAGSKAAGRQELLTDREKTLAKYVAGGDRNWLALRRIRAAEALVGESTMP
jgi:hypothetical protein